MEAAKQKASTGWRLLGKVLEKRHIEKRKKASLLQDTLIPSVIKMCNKYMSIRGTHINGAP